jgi:hypothetical protein
VQTPENQIVALTESLLHVLYSRRESLWQHAISQMWHFGAQAAYHLAGFMA